MIYNRNVTLNADQIFIIIKSSGSKRKHAINFDQKESAHTSAQTQVRVQQPIPSPQPANFVCK